MGTTRISRGSGGAPTTDFYTEVDWVSQNQAGNYSTLHIYVKAVNRGSTGSYDSTNGSHIGQVDNVAAPGHSGTLPSGVPTNGTRWYDGPWGYNVGHDANGYLGNLTVRQIISGWFSFNDTAVLPAPARIPKKPSSPGTPTASEVLPQSMRITWTGSGDNAGSSIDGYLLRRWDTADGTGSYVDISQTNDLSRVVTGLTPGKTYSWRVYAHNGSADNNGYSIASGLLVKAAMAPARIKVSGVYKYAIPYVKVSGVYKMALPYVKVAGAWKQSA